ncbi:hypothetical protein K435DRAFT_801217 [Dendrothele bispora CBS 962.96]|uniref:Ribonuclease H1 N-terminal domain-containing protein n=1 Tax=Dendrothele bispora (strain CBS 962.96) TaxID=1314807 RepID=A0A4V4HEL0_DENBC|nr:hypothetical protein K435DRAFT_801217 [Dendrothele bispora CBS 962.96]
MSGEDPDRSQRIDLTGKQEILFLLEKGIPFDDLPMVIARRKVLRIKWKKKQANAAYYQRHRVELMEHNRMSSQRRRELIHTLPQARQEEVREEIQLSHWMYRRANRKKLAEKERERRARKKGERHDASENSSQMSVEGEQIEGLGTNVSDEGIWDWVSSGEDPLTTCEKLASFFSHEFPTGTLAGTRKYFKLVDHSNTELPEPPQGRVEGKKWLYEQFSRLTGAWFTPTDDAYHNALRSVFLVREEIISSYLSWNNAPENPDSFPTDLTDEAWCQEQAQRVRDADGLLPTFSGSEVEAKRMFFFPLFRSVEENLNRSKRILRELGRARAQLSVADNSWHRNNLLVAAQVENERRINLQQERERLYPNKIVFSHLRQICPPRTPTVVKTNRCAKVKHNIWKNNIRAQDLFGSLQVVPTYDIVCRYCHDSHDDRSDEETISISSSDKSSETDLWNQLEDLEEYMAATPSHSEPVRPTCKPHVYGEEGFRPKKWYLILNGMSPGCFMSWSDVAERVSKVSGASYESFKTYEDALHAWKQHCLGHHNHGPDFVDGSFYSPPEPVLPSRAITPPPRTPVLNRAQDNVASRPPSTPSSPSSLPVMPSRRRVTRAFFGPGSPARVQAPQPRGSMWAISSAGNNGVLTAVEADAVLEEAQLRNVPVEACEVNGIVEATEWFSMFPEAISEIGVVEVTMQIFEGYLEGLQPTYIHSFHSRRYRIMSSDSTSSIVTAPSPPSTTPPAPVALPASAASNSTERPPGPEQPRSSPSPSNGHESASPPSEQTQIQSSAATSKDASSNTVPPKQSGKQKNKRRNKGNFHGPRLEYLNKELPGWLGATRAGKSLWLTAFYDRWFKKFRWHLTECPEDYKVLEPTPKPTPTDPNAVGEPTPTSTGLTPEDFDKLKEERDSARAQVIKKAKDQLAAWFWRQSSKASQPIAGADQFSGFLKLLCNVGRPPRRLLPHKFYMAHEEFAEKCHTTFQERWPNAGLGPSFRLDFQCKVAQELFEEESDDVKARIDAELQEEYDSKLKAYQQLMKGDKFAIEGIEEFGEMAKEICRQNLVKFLQPLLDLLQRLTDLSIFVMAGSPPPPGGNMDEFTLLTVSSGTTIGANPKKFEEWKRDDFSKGVVGPFLLFLLQTVEDVSTDPNSIDANTIQRASERAAEATADPADNPNMLTMPDNDEKVIEKPKKKTKGKKKTKSAETMTEETELEPDTVEPDVDAESTAQPQQPRPKPKLRSKTPSLPDDYDWVLHPETKLYIEQLSDDEPRKVLRQIRGHSKADFDRGNNIYKLKYLSMQLDKRLAEKHSKGPAPIRADTWHEEMHQIVNRIEDSDDVMEMEEENNDVLDSTPAASTSAEPAVLIQNPTSTTLDPAPTSTPASPASSIPASPIPASQKNPTNSETSTETELDSSEVNDGIEPTENLREIQTADSSLSNAEPVPSHPLPALSSVTYTDDVIPAEDPSWPAWLKSAYRVFGDQPGLREEEKWLELLSNWTEIEQKYSFENPQGAPAFYTAASRPEVVTWWSRNGKKVRKEVPEEVLVVVGEHES